MWHLGHKEGWAPKNWCFQTVVMKKTLKSPLNSSKEINPVNPKGNPPWIFIGRTDAEAEAPILWKPDMKSHWKRSWCWEKPYEQPPEKIFTLGKTEGRRRRGDRRWDVEWHYGLNGNEIKQTPGVSGGQRSLMSCSPWGCKESYTTERLNNNKVFKVTIIKFYGKSGLKANSRRVQVLIIKRKST